MIGNKGKKPAAALQLVLLSALVLLVGACHRADTLSPGEREEIRAGLRASADASPVDSPSPAPAERSADIPDAGKVDNVAAERPAVVGDDDGAAEFRFTAVVIKIDPLPAHRGPIMVVANDPRFAVVVQVLRELEGRLPMDETTRRLTLGIHSIVLDLSPDGEVAREGKVMEFTIRRRPGGSRRLRVSSIQ